jgi:murein hydrolase activator
MRRSALWALLCIVPLAAQAAPSDELAKTQEALKQSKQAEEKIAAQQATLEAELRILQEKLVKLTRQLQQKDTQLEAVQRKLDKIEHELQEKEESFAVRRRKLDGLSRMAIRLSRTPPQAMVLMPVDGKNRMQAAHALSFLSAEMKIQAEKIQEEMSAIADLKETVEADKEKAEKMRDANQAEKKKFEALMKTRGQLRAKLAASRAREEKKIAQLARKANSLQELLVALEVESQKKRMVGRGADKDVDSGAGIRGERGRLRSFKSARGDIRAPVSGRVVEAYGVGGSKGIKIAARGSATVVAPFDAEVAYSGTFLNYGRMVILKHRGEYHTLLAGLARIDVQTGEFLLEGEPIGAMDGGEKKTLYVELRENNQPVNPASWIHGL